MSTSLDAAIAAIRGILAGAMAHPHLAAFGPDARLEDDLRLDSVLRLQLLLELELQAGLAAPEAAISSTDIVTVADLARLLVGETAPEVSAAPDPADDTHYVGVHGELDYDIKIHCVVSCLCDALKQAGVDHRPFHLAVPDAAFAVTPDWRLAYHAAAVDHAPLLHWFTRLHGVAVEDWYDRAATKAENIARLDAVLALRAPTTSVMVMLDMFHLPERENKFNQDPFPHYLLLETTADPAVWLVRDVDYRWEGPIARDRLVHAISRPTVAGGYRFDRATARDPNPADLAAFVRAVVPFGVNPLVEALRLIVEAHLAGRDGVRLEDLEAALAELPILIIRKYGYEHGLAWFWRALKLPAREFDRWCDEIEALVAGLKSVHFAALKLARGRTPELVADIRTRLADLDARERAIKQRLGEVFELWAAANLPGAEVIRFRRAS